MNTVRTFCCKDILGIKILLNTVRVSVNLKSSIINVEEMKCLKGELVQRAQAISWLGRVISTVVEIVIWTCVNDVTYTL